MIMLFGFITGSLARLAVPGPDPMPIWLTVAIGLAGSAAGGGLAIAIWGRGTQGIGIFSFIGHWNDFLGPLIFLNSQDKYTVALGVNMFFGEFQVHMDLVMAYSVMVTLPIVLVFFIFQRYFVQGIALTGLTGR